MCEAYTVASRNVQFLRSKNVGNGVAASERCSCEARGAGVLPTKSGFPERRKLIGGSDARSNARPTKNYPWGCSSAGRAPALQAGGQEFDSPHLHQHDFFCKAKKRAKRTP